MLWLATGLQVVALLIRAAKLGSTGYPLVAATIALSLLVAAAALGAPARALDALGRLVRRAGETTRRTAATLFLVSLAVFGFDTVLQQPDAWDERGLLDGALLIADRGFAGFADAYRTKVWLAAQHPPLSPLLYAAAWRLGVTTPGGLRWISALFASGAIVVAWRVLERFLERRVAVCGAALLLTSPLMVRIGSAIGNDPPLLFFFWLALLCGLRLLEAPSNTRSAALGAVLGLGLLTKYTMVLVGPILLTMPWATRRPWPRWRHMAVLLPVAALALAWVAAMASLGALDTQIEKLSWLGTTALRHRRFVAAALLVHLPSAVGVYALPVAWSGLRRLRPRHVRGEAWLLLWILGVGLPVTLTLPASRFFLPAFPAVTGILALGLERGFDRDGRRRAILLMAGFCAALLLYYAYVDLRVLMRI